jgi:hypothetical protein
MQILSSAPAATTSLQQVRRLNAKQKLFSDIGRVRFSASGIKPHSRSVAPPGEFIGAKVNAQHPSAALLQHLFTAFGRIQPGFVSAMGCDAAVIANGDQTGVVRGLEPDQGGCLGTESHGETSAVEAHQFNSSVISEAQKGVFKRASADVPQQCCDEIIAKALLTRAIA